MKKQSKNKASKEEKLHDDSLGNMFIAMMEARGAKFVDVVIEEDDEVLFESKTRRDKRGAE